MTSIGFEKDFWSRLIVIHKLSLSIHLPLCGGERTANSFPATAEEGRIEGLERDEHGYQSGFVI